MCDVLEVSRSGYYAYRRRDPSARDVDDAALAEKVQEIFVQYRECYGSPRIARELRDAGHRVSKHRVARLMREQGLRASIPRRHVVTTDSRHDEPIAENVLEQDFTAEAPDRKWAGDITYIRTDEGWLYLAVFIDLFSRMVVGWSMSESLSGEITRDALLMALNARVPEGRLVVHSDRGVQYAALDFRKMLKDWSITPSMSAKGNCYDNAVSESFFATLKKELVYREHYQTRSEARASIFEYIEVFYNRTRRHSTIGYVSPARYEADWHRERASTAESATVGNPSPTEGFSTGVDGSNAAEITPADSMNPCPL